MTTHQKGFTDCEDCQHIQELAKINSKWGIFYRLDPWYREVIKTNRKYHESKKNDNWMCAHHDVEPKE